MGGDLLDSGEVRLCRRDAAVIAAAIPVGPGQAARPNVGKARAAQGLERENRELKRRTDILRKASAFFAQAELDRKQS